jgi:predicted nucleic acid-binding protein
MLILDTQHVSQLQRENSRDAVSLQSKIDVEPTRPILITVITAYEQFRGCLAGINAERGAEQLRFFALLARLLDFYGKWAGRILPTTRLPHRSSSTLNQG